MTTRYNAELLQKAIQFATISHGGQFRKGDGSPYIAHPMSVMRRAFENKKSTNAYLLGIAAILHDTVEDCGVTLDTIAKEFGYYAAALVEELTLDKDQYEEIGKTEYLCQELTNMTSYALFIKLCDRLDNVLDMKSMHQLFITKYSKETVTILQHLIDHRGKLTKTHNKLIEQIYEALNSYATDDL